MCMRVQLLRVLHEAETSVIVRVLSSNAVLRCVVCSGSLQGSRSLLAGNKATLHVIAYNPPCLSVTVAQDTDAEHCCRDKAAQAPDRLLPGHPCRRQRMHFTPYNQ